MLLFIASSFLKARVWPNNPVLAKGTEGENKSQHVNPGRKKEPGALLLLTLGIMNTVSDFFAVFYLLWFLEYFPLGLHLSNAVF